MCCVGSEECLLVVKEQVRSAQLFGRFDARNESFCGVDSATGNDAAALKVFFNCACPRNVSVERCKLKFEFVLRRLDGCLCCCVEPSVAVLTFLHTHWMRFSAAILVAVADAKSSAAFLNAVAFCLMPRLFALDSESFKCLWHTLASLQKSTHACSGGERQFANVPEDAFKSCGGVTLKLAVLQNCEFEARLSFAISTICASRVTPFAQSPLCRFCNAVCAFDTCSSNCSTPDRGGSAQEEFVIDLASLPMWVSTLHDMLVVTRLGRLVLPLPAVSSSTMLFGCAATVAATRAICAVFAT